MVCVVVDNNILQAEDNILKVDNNRTEAEDNMLGDSKDNNGRPVPNPTLINHQQPIRRQALYTHNLLHDNHDHHHDHHDRPRPLGPALIGLV